MAFLVGYDTVASYVTFIVNEDRFPCFDGKGADYIPDPIISPNAFNRNLRFSTSKPGFVDVDWGDGTKDQYPLVKISNGSYRIVFRSLDIEYKKNPDDTVWWYKKEDGSQYIPVPPHKYSDIRRREVTMRFSNVIDGEFNMDGIVLHEFPIANLPDITYFAVVRSVLKNGDIPYDRISKSVNLRHIQMGSFIHPGVWSNWPEGFLNMKDLMYFGCNNVFNFGDDPDSNWRRFSEWKNLTNFNFNWCNIPSYDPAFNSIPAKDIRIISDRNNIPVFDEVYVLTNNYGQTWVLAPAPASKAALTRARRAGKARITPFVLGVKDGHVSVFSGDVLDDNMSKYNFADKYEAIDICNDYTYGEDICAKK